MLDHALPFSGLAAWIAEFGCFGVDRTITSLDSMPFFGCRGIADGLQDIPCRSGLSCGFAGGETLWCWCRWRAGLTAVELGKLMGARVIAVARGADKCAIATQAGADHAIDATDAAFTCRP